MTFAADDIGVQSWCFRHFKQRSQLIAQLKGCGLSLRPGVVHADFSDESTFASTIRELRGGITIASIGVQPLLGR